MAPRKSRIGGITGLPPPWTAMSSNNCTAATIATAKQATTAGAKSASITA